MSKNITILIPLFNTVHRVRECALSVARQSDKNFKVIVSDNFSTDGSGELLRDIFDDNGIDYEYVRQSENFGGLRNFLFLLERVDTDYFLFLDSEDELSENYVFEVNNIIANERPDVVVPGFFEYGLNGVGRELVAYKNIDVVPFEARLPYVVTLTNNSGVCYFWYSVFDTGECLSIWRKILSEELRVASRYGCSDIALAYAFLAKAPHLIVADQISLKHFARRVVDEARIKINIRGIEELYAPTPFQVIDEAVGILERINCIDEDFIKLIRSIILYKYSMLTLQHELLSRLKSV